MSVENLLPALHTFTLRNPNNKQDFLINLKEMDGQCLEVKFDLSGLDKLVNPITGKRVPFYLYLFLFHQKGGKEVEILSSASFYCDENKLEIGNLGMETPLKLPEDIESLIGDFTNNFFSIELLYSPKELEDGSDLNLLLNNPESRLFKSKVAIISEEY
ncbi:hypothetical protein [Sutcliffiella sp. BMC8]